MRITELFTAKSIELDSAASNRDEILSRLVELQATHGNITDTEAYKKALYAREDEASTYVDNGITVPHAKTNVVTRPSLAALRLSTPVQYNAEDDGKTDLLFAIAAPENGSLHVDMLARMMQMLMNEDFVEKLKAAKTPAEFLALIDAQEEAQAAANIIAGHSLRMEERRKKAAAASEQRVQLTMDAGALENRIRLLREMEKDYEGFSKAVKLVCQAKGTLRGIHGPVANLMKTDGKYSLAIEIALGAGLQNIVVDREEDGKAVIQYLKRRDAGRATILPLSSIRPGELREGQALRREPGFVGVGDQLISFQPQYRNVFSNLLGRVAVMEEGRLRAWGTPAEIYAGGALEEVFGVKVHRTELEDGTEQYLFTRRGP